MAYQEFFTVNTQGRGTYDITPSVRNILIRSGLGDGLCHVFVQHTSASLMLCENADPRVRHDLEIFMSRIAPDGDPAFIHDDEGPDDMPAHIRSVLTKMDLTVPVVGGKLATGTWQGIYLWEHRTRPHQRNVIVTLIG